MDILDLISRHLHVKLIFEQRWSKEYDLSSKFR